MNSWSLSDIEVVSRAIVSAPSVHDTQPWDLRLDGTYAEITERRGFTDTPRADRVISCGAGVANVELALRALGRQIETDLLPDPRRPELVATVRSVGTTSPSSTDLRLFSAMARRRSHREAFADIPVPAATIADIVSAAETTGVRARLLAADEAPALADVLLYSADRVRHDPRHQRDLFPWTSHWLPRVGHESVDTIHTVVTRGVPDSARLAAAIEGETVLVFASGTQESIDLVRTGIAVERAWLTAVDARLGASILSYPLRVDDTAQRLARRLNLPGNPQLILRIGY
ncbi:nitroreductase family protein [Rhodococcus jostii]|uniref:Nitroreductase family protein n=1 Tax=Rhodococcus jostii TaxID=132919 RepID=A0A1H4YJH6_RHOJO|nr:nitroreductase family protein [Rhodococcus jostii]SED18063.1 Nitroreductase family protein [Rhodococcus jostii]